MTASRATIAAAAVWLEQIATDGLASPTDDQIMERYRLISIEAARSLLATLAEQGKITIRGGGFDRVILIGRPTPKPFVGERPTRVIVTPSAREAARGPSRIDQMRAISANLASARKDLGASPKPTTMPTPVKKSDETKAPIIAAPGKVAPIVPAPVAKAAEEAAGAAGRKQVNIPLPVAAYLEAARRANGRPVSTYLREEVLAMLAGTTTAANSKPLVPAEVTAAAIREGTSVAAFVRALILRGFLAHQSDAAQERAA